MKSLIVLSIYLLIVVAILFYAIYLIVKDFTSNIRRKKLLSITFSVILFSSLATYSIALFFKRSKIIEQVGSSDAWIGFAGACMSGIITMLALYFTLKHNEEINQANRLLLLKPYLSCNITNLDNTKTKIKLKNYIGQYDYIECKMKNISSNIANAIKITDEYSMIETSKNVYCRVDDMLDNYGISIYTISLNEGTFLAPHEDYNWKTNICIELDEIGNYKWNASAFAFKHMIHFEFTDIENLQKYNHKFEFEININVDTDNNLHFFLWNINNSVNPIDVKEK